LSIGNFENAKEEGMRIEVVANVRPHLGEGPQWDAKSERIYWVDSINSKIFRCTADGRELRAWDVPQQIGAFALRETGGALLALQRGFYLFDFETGKADRLLDPEPHNPKNRLNDGKVDRAGRFFVGSMDTTEAENAGSLYRVDPDLSVRKLDSGIKCSNGPCWSPDNRTFYFHDSWAGETWAYDYDILTGKVSNRRTFVQHQGEGAPDGATVDSEGYVWIAKCFGSRIDRFAPDGRLDRSIPIPVAKVTSVAFGGSNLDILFVTSMSRPHLPQYPDEDGVIGGSLFAIHGLGVKGIAELRFAG
jgi:sugar lactone lactonase YvrE